MILNCHPDQPGKKTKLKFIGYWHAISVDPISLMPTKLLYSFDHYANTFGEFGLPIPSDYVDQNWDYKERLAVMDHLESGKEYEAWKGYSSCRFGCIHDNGSVDFTDGTYVWPEGFVHYIQVHGVKPPQEFIDHVLGQYWC